jgi:hypothetical protein
MEVYTIVGKKALLDLNKDAKLNFKDISIWK